MNLHKKSDSKVIALERLNRVILKDRTDFSADIMESLAKDILLTISNYMEPDRSRAKIYISPPTDGEMPVLNISIPITDIFKETQVD